MELTKNEIKIITSLRMKKFRDQYGLFAVEGIKAVGELINSKVIVEYLVITGSLANDEKVKKIMSEVAKRKISVYVIKDKEYEKITFLDTAPGVMCIAKMLENGVKINESYLILDQIKDPGNLGTILRTADWFGLNNIILSNDSVDVYNPKVIQATMGSMFRLNIAIDQNVEEFTKELLEKNYTVIATSLEGQESLPIINDKKYAVIIGNESNGVSDQLLKLATDKYKIKNIGKAESLNVAVATGIVLYELNKK